MDTAPETKPAGISPETVTSPESIARKFHETFDIQPDELEAIAGFPELSAGRKLLVLENLKQLAVGRIQNEAQAKYRANTEEAGFLGRLWQGVTKNYQIAKLENVSADQILKSGIAGHGDILEELVEGAKHGPDAIMVPDGKLEIQYASLDVLQSQMGRDLTDEEKDLLADANHVFTRFSHLPADWGLTSASLIDRKKFYDAQKQFDEAVNYIVGLPNSAAPRSGFAWARNIEKNVKLNQLLNAHPDVDRALKGVTEENVWMRVAKDTITERGLIAGSGFLVRSATISAIGALGVPLAGGLVGGALAYKRTWETIREEEKRGRIGAVTKEDRELFHTDEEGELVAIGKTISREKRDFIDAASLNRRLDSLIEKLEAINPIDEPAEAKRNLINDHISRLVKYSHAKIDAGLVNFGTTDKKRLVNQYTLLNKLGSLYGYMNTLYLTPRDGERLNLALNLRVEKISQAQKDKVRLQVVRGIGLGMGFATAGYLARHFSEALGWAKPHQAEAAGGRGVGRNDSTLKIENVPTSRTTHVPNSQSQTEVPAPTPIITNPSETPANPVEASKPTPGIAETTPAAGKPEQHTEQVIEVKPGDSPLKIMQRYYAEHAATLGPKFGADAKLLSNDMGLHDWAKSAAARHLVGQYILEYGYPASAEPDAKAAELFEKIFKGLRVADNPKLMNELLSKLSKEEFNLILNEKVSNLLHVGDKLMITASGDLRHLGPMGGRGHIEIAHETLERTERPDVTLPPREPKYQTIDTEVRETEAKEQAATEKVAVAYLGNEAIPNEDDLVNPVLPIVQHIFENPGGEPATDLQTSRLEGLSQYFEAGGVKVSHDEALNLIREFSKTKVTDMRNIDDVDKLYKFAGVSDYLAQEFKSHPDPQIKPTASAFETLKNFLYERAKIARILNFPQVLLGTTEGLEHTTTGFDDLEIYFKEHGSELSRQELCDAVNQFSAMKTNSLATLQDPIRLRNYAFISDFMSGYVDERSATAFRVLTKFFRARMRTT